MYFLGLEDWQPPPLHCMTRPLIDVWICRVYMYCIICRIYIQGVLGEMCQICCICHWALVAVSVVASPKSNLLVALTRQNTTKNRNINSFTKDTTECWHSRTFIGHRLLTVWLLHAPWHPGYKLSYCKHQYMHHNYELLSTSPGLSMSFNFHTVNLFWVVMCSSQHCQGLCAIIFGVKRLFEISGSAYPVAQHNIPEKLNFQHYCCHNLKSLISRIVHFWHS
jgi:hypothetical protein